MKTHSQNQAQNNTQTFTNLMKETSQNLTHEKQQALYDIAHIGYTATQPHQGAKNDACAVKPAGTMFLSFHGWKQFHLFRTKKQIEMVQYGGIPRLDSTPLAFPAEKISETADQRSRDERLLQSIHHSISMGNKHEQ